MSDRAVQDEIIRYLADASVRTQLPLAAPVGASEAPKAVRFAHFLARRYYRDRLARSFRYSHRFQKQTGRTAEEIVDTDQFDRFLGECLMGSLESSRRVGEMARAYLTVSQPPGPWWAELLEYEYCYFLQAATSERTPPAKRPTRGMSAVLRQFEWALPEILPRLRAGEPIDENLRRGITLLFSRTESGRVYVVQAGAELESVFRATDGVRSLEEIAALAGMSVDQARQALGTLNEIGAICESGTSSN